ncbi:hypothetical protein SISSUDRAFT_1128362 [Sistotremastrum suecicum HHB10207 ss-3]|uniref:DUF6533 domain-containing protein n=1 Tax=Sistotremastrum suecicum HHB10207 ss-3 TaxID=1314776 RepID=A0A166DXA8_9AGAM|nr:hypothetical protein SISSUDRAFT_1128362 [Sistotremastrum suecicum HHB10207 ss-3]
MDVQEEALFLNSLLVSRYGSVCGLTMCVADIATTLPREVLYYWGTAWSLPKILYFYMRYCTLLQQLFLTIALFYPPSNLFCQISVNIQFVMAMSLLWSIEITLVLRIHALYCHKRLWWLMWILFILSTVISAVFGFREINSAMWYVEVVLNLPCCLAANADLLQHSFWTSWVVTLGFESMIVALAFRALYHYRGLYKNHTGPETLVWTLLRDSIAYYLVILLSGIIYMVVAKELWFNGEIASSILFPLISACGVRLLFRLKTKNAEISGENISTQGVGPASNIEFKIGSRQPDASDTMVMPSTALSTI